MPPLASLPRTGSASSRNLILAALLLLALPLTALAQNTRIDLLVVYTPAARAYYGGTSGMLAHINASVTAANTAYTNSQVTITLNLVGTAETTYSENSDMSVDLSRLQGTSDGFMDEVHALRTQVGADLVCLFRRDQTSGAAGIGYLNGPGSNGAYGFCVVADWTAISNHTFAHELGHNQGSHHASPEATSGGAFGYSYGHRFYGGSGTQYRTVMAYAPGTRIAHFSNPSVTYSGTATGVSNSADNARSHNDMRSTVAGWRNSPLPAISSHPASLTRVAGTSATFSVTATGSSLTYAWSKGGSPISGATAASYTIASVVTGDAGSYTVTVTNEAGSTTSSAATLTVVASTTPSGIRDDFNGDGKADLLFFNQSTGQRSVWLMDGTTLIQANILPGANTAWRPMAIGDFNGDDRPDIIYFNASTGQRSIWLMDGTTVLSTNILTGANTQWEPRGAGDCDGDGKDDILFYNNVTGARSIWLMDGITLRHTVAMIGANTAWQPVAMGNFDDDGLTDDIVFYNFQTGQRSIWICAIDGNGVHGATAWLQTGANTAWAPVGAADFNDDGKDDLIFFNASTGVRSVWLMDGVNLQSTVQLTGANTAWLPSNR